MKALEAVELGTHQVRYGAQTATSSPARLLIPRRFSVIELGDCGGDGPRGRHSAEWISL